MRIFLSSCVVCFVFLLILGTDSAFAAQELKVGFVEGRGEDAVFEGQAFTAAGIEYTPIVAADYQVDRLLEFDVIAVGVVAYDQNEDLKANFKVLLEYVNKGGYLVTLDFQQDSTWDKGFFPHPLELFDDDLEEGGAEMQEHPAWKTPNEITPEHFVGWGAGDFMADGPHEAMAPWETLLILGGWPVIVGAQAGDGYVVFNSLQVLQALGKTSSEMVVDVMENLLFWRGPVAVDAKGKLASAWGGIKTR